MGLLRSEGVAPRGETCSEIAAEGGEGEVAEPLQQQRLGMAEALFKERRSRPARQGSPALRRDCPWRAVRTRRVQ
jgi:hypothetical protein